MIELVMLDIRNLYADTMMSARRVEQKINERSLSVRLLV